MSSQPTASAPPSQKRSKLPVLIAGVLLLAGGGVVAFQKLSKKPEGGHAQPSKKPVVIEPAVLEPDPFILNLPDPTGDRYFRVDLSLVLDQKEVVKRAQEGLADVKLRDRIQTVISKKRAGQLTTVEGKERLRQELKDAVDLLLREPPFFEEETEAAPAHVMDVLFKAFLVQ